ncbi:MAG TPA: hypothetical protein VHC71_00915 [Hyphomicrobium sp.]|jgi:hypothetical protein|nr:hypothetical protein [Hyphomicrobium sp.]
MHNRLLFSFMAFVIPSPAFAITCHGNYQVVNGQEISTPYCRDNVLAEIARQSGFDVSNSTMRHNPSRKEEICRYLQSDIRVDTACAEVLPDGGGRGR